MLQRLQAGGGVRELVALSIRVDDWFPLDQPLDIPRSTKDAFGVTHGWLLPWPAAQDQETTRWLVSDARMLVVPRLNPSSSAQLIELADLEEEAAPLAAALRRSLLDRYLDTLSLASQTDLLLQRCVAEVLTLARSSDAATREHLLSALRATMAEQRATWGPVAVHLRSGFETALAERKQKLVQLGVGALIELATKGPFPPPAAGDPSRILEVLFRMPRAEILAETLREVRTLPDSTFARLESIIAPHARDALTHEDATVRREAGEVELRLAALAPGAAEEPVPVAHDAGGTAGGAADELQSILADLSSEAAYRRARALRNIGDRAIMMPPLLPRLLDALDDPDDEVRRAALRAVRPLMAAESDAVRERTVTAMVRSRDAQAVRAGLSALGDPPFAVKASLAEALMFEALEGPKDAREQAALRVAGLQADRDPTNAASGYGRLLRHPDPVVRIVALRSLARDAVGRLRLRDALTHDLMARLEDPEPELRASSLRTLAALAHPGARDIAVRQAADPDPIVRQAAMEVVEQIGDEQLRERAAVVANDVGALFELAHGGDGDARMRWARALSNLAEGELPDLAKLLVNLLKSVPAGTNEPFLRFALEEIDRRILDSAHLAPGGLPGICRRLVEAPHPRPEHAARLAAAGAADDAQLFDLLWTMATVGQGAAAEAARRGLVSLRGRRIAEPVQQAAKAAWRGADGSQRDALRTLFGRRAR